MHPSWNHSLLLGEKTKVEQSNASEKSKKQPVDKYKGRVRSVTEDVEIQTTEVL